MDPEWIKVTILMLLFFFKYYFFNVNYRSLNKQLKDKKEHRDRLEADLKVDATKAVELTKKIEEQSQELERQKNCIDEHNKQIYELKKNKDQYQSTRK